MNLRATALVRVVALLALLVASVTSCGDGTPKFCADLNRVQKLDGLASALRSNDLDKADAEAQKLKELADKAPSDIRSDLTALADGVVDIIDLVKRDQDANSVSESEAGATSPDSTKASGSDGGTDNVGDANSSSTSNLPVDDDTQDDLTVTTPPTSEPTDVEQRRNELNERLGELDKRSENVTNWALEQCGIKL